MKRLFWTLSALPLIGLLGCTETGTIHISAHSEDLEFAANDNDDDSTDTPNDVTPSDSKKKSDDQDDDALQDNHDPNNSKIPDDAQTNDSVPHSDDNSSENQNDPDVNTPSEPSDSIVCECKDDEICLPDGTCQKQCNSDEQLCEFGCTNLASLNLSDCNTCAANYCDSDSNLANGCEIDVMGSDNNNCGSCGHICDAGTTCNAGECKSVCAEGETWCDGTCLNLASLHLASCGACAENYCDTDGNLANGCESFALGEDANNCGVCGNTCQGACSGGQCVKAFRAMAMTNLNFAANADGSGGTTGSAKTYDYVQVIQESNGMSKVSMNGQTGWVSSANLMDACDDACPSRKAIDLAETYLYTKTHLCSYDFLTHEPYIENFADFSWLSGANQGYDLNCANFVTAILITTGLYSGKISTVDGARTNAASSGYHYLSDFSQAKPGDIWTCGDQHAELVVGYHNGNLVLIGSNNFGNGDGYNNCVNTYSTDPTAYQRVSYGSAQWCSHAQYVMTRQ